LLTGTNNQIPCIFVSENSFDLARKAADINEMSQSCCIRISNDNSTGVMDVDKLQESIDYSLSIGLSPLMIIASLGSKHNRKCDPIKEIAALARENNLWLHIDESFGGPLLFSQRLKKKCLEGIQFADSILCGMESLLGAPHCTTFLVTPHPNICLDSLGLGDTVLYEKSSLYDSTFDRGDSSLQI